MQRRAEHTYALPSSRSSTGPSASGQPSHGRQSVPPSPQSRPNSILVPAASQYSSSGSYPLAYKRSSGPRPATPQTKPGAQQPKQPAIDLRGLVAPEARGYVPADWSLLAIERPKVKSKYIVTLLFWPTMTLFAWPIDPHKSPESNRCFVTPIGTNTNSGTANAATVNASVRVLMDAVRTWIRLTRSLPMRRLTGAVGKQIAPNQDIEHVSRTLQLAPATEDQRLDWLRRQRLPEDLPLSATSSPASTPSPQESSRASYFDTLPRSPAPASLSVPNSPALMPTRSATFAAEDTSRIPRKSPSLQLNTSTDDSGSSQSGLPAFSITEPSPVLPRVMLQDDSGGFPIAEPVHTGRTKDQNEQEELQKQHELFDALSLRDA